MADRSWRTRWTARTVEEARRPPVGWLPESLDAPVSEMINLRLQVAELISTAILSVRFRGRRWMQDGGRAMKEKYRGIPLVSQEQDLKLRRINTISQYPMSDMEPPNR